MSIINCIYATTFYKIQRKYAKNTQNFDIRQCE